MKKSAIFLTLLLVASLAGTYGVYELYVKDRLRELGEHIEQKKKLEQRITGLQNTFMKTEPQVVLDAWRGSTQPWSEAVDGRARFFTLGDMIPEVKIPQEILPKIWYGNEMPKRITKLTDYARDKNVTVADTNCGAPQPKSFGEGTNPKPEEIIAIVNKFDYCAAFTVMLIDARAEVVQPLAMWPEKAIKVKSGQIMERTAGISVQIRSQWLMRLLDNLAQSNRYFRVEELKITNTDLLQPDPLLNVDMVLTQAYFVPAKKSKAVASASTANVNQRLNSVFSEDTRRPLSNVPQRTWWQEFRRQWLPF